MILNILFRKINVVKAIWLILLIISCKDQNVSEDRNIENKGYQLVLLNSHHQLPTIVDNTPILNHWFTCSFSLINHTLETDTVFFLAYDQYKNFLKLPHVRFTWNERNMFRTGLASRIMPPGSTWDFEMLIEIDNRVYKSGMPIKLQMVLVKNVNVEKEQYGLLLQKMALDSSNIITLDVKL